MKVLKKITGIRNGKKFTMTLGREFAVQPFYVGGIYLLGKGRTQVMCSGSFDSLEQAEAFIAQLVA